MATAAVSSGSGNSGSYEVPVDQVLDLSTTNGELQSIIKKATGPEGSDEAVNNLLSALNSRSNKSLAISNLLKSLGDTARALIQNIRP